MTPASISSPEPHQDAVLLALWQERASLWRARDAAYQEADQRGVSGTEMDAITQRFWDEEDVPEGRIVNTPALTPEGLAVKLRLLALFSFENRDVEDAVFDGGPRPEEAADDGDFRHRLLWGAIKDAEGMPSAKSIRAGDEALLRLWDVYLIASREQRKAMADPQVCDDDDFMHGLCARIWGLRDQIAAMPATTPAGWSCTLKLALLDLVSLPELECHAESFGGPPPDRIANPEHIEDQGMPWIYSVVAEMDRASGGRGVGAPPR